MGERQRGGLDTSLGDIARAPRLGGSQVTVIRRTRQLEATGLLHIGPSPRHHRRLQVELTEAAIALLNEVSSRVDQLAQATINRAP